MNLNYTFKDGSLLELALTQSGANATENNERLEFLGDRVLGLSVASLIYEMYPNETEGELARRHSVLVSTIMLSEIAVSMDIEKKIKHGHMTAGRKAHILADAVESVLGAIYMDGGFEAAKKVVYEIWTPVARRDVVAPKDPKTALQEFVQHNDNNNLPKYEYTEEKGPSHSPKFTVKVSAMNKTAAAIGTSKKSAATAAAVKLLEELKSCSDSGSK
jgi:ribonuclease-3